MADPEIMALIEEVDRSMGDEGSVLVRPSGRTPDSCHD